MCRTYNNTKDNRNKDNNTNTTNNTNTNITNNNNHQAASLCDPVKDDVELIDSSLEVLWDTLDDGAELVSCENIGGLYRSVVYDELCGALPRALMVLLLSCVLLFVLLLLLVSESTRSTVSAFMCISLVCRLSFGARTGDEHLWLQAGTPRLASFLK